MFTEGFDKMVLDHERIRCVVDGFECVAWTERDDDGRGPAARMDHFWPSLDPLDPGYIGVVSTEEWGRLYDRANAVMRGWENDEWDYCAVVVEVRKAGVTLTERYDHALWGIERNYPGGDGNAYLADVANNLLPDALEAARKRLRVVLAELSEGLDPPGSTGGVPDVWDRIKREAASRRGG